MKSKRQRYWLVLHARPEQSADIQAKHARFFAESAHLIEPWGAGTREVPTLKIEYGTIVLSLSKFYGKRAVHQAVLRYNYQRNPTDNVLDDDALTITFDPARVDTQYLTSTVIPAYIRAFDTYLVEYFDDPMIDDMAERLKGRPRNSRQFVHRVGLVSYFDEQLCRRAFGMTPAEVVDRVRGIAERAEVLNDGAYVIGSSSVLPLAECEAKCRELTAAVIGEASLWHESQ